MGKMGSELFKIAFGLEWVDRVELCMFWRGTANDLCGVGSHFVFCAVNKLSVMEQTSLTLFHLVNKFQFIFLQPSEKDKDTNAKHGVAQVNFPSS